MNPMKLIEGGTQMENSTTYKTLKFMPIGDSWGYAIMDIEDDRGSPKVRLAKCKYNTTFKLAEEQNYTWIDLGLEHIVNGDISQLQIINFNTREEAIECFKQLDDDGKVVGISYGCADLDLMGYASLSQLLTHIYIILKKNAQIVLGET